MQVVAQLKGESQLPWEGSGAPAAALRGKLGAFKAPILSLLRRDPAERESLRHFQSLCTHGHATARR